MIAPRSAEIIAVGHELLTPFRVDTNSLHLTGRLNDLGITVRMKAVVGDDPADLTEVFGDAMARSDVIILTGGLGPTADDVTRETVARALGLPLDEDAATLQAIQERFARRKQPMPATNRRQAQAPRGAMLLPNANGTAPGIVIERPGRLIVLLPGPPRELQPMFDEFVVPRLAAFAGPSGVRRRVIKLTGRSESQVDEVAHPIYSTLSTAAVLVSTSILASASQIELHLSGTGAAAAEVDAVLEAGVSRLFDALTPAVFSVDGRSLEAVVGDQLRARGWRAAAAESCTGGLLLGRMTDVAGSSAWVQGGVVAYDNAVKTGVLGVPAEAIAAHGAVSQEVARLMADGARERFAADVAVAITGIAGPGGGTPAKPVGTVAIAVSGPSPLSRLFLFPGDRQVVRTHAVTMALDMLRRASA